MFSASENKLVRVAYVRSNSQDAWMVSKAFDHLIMDPELRNFKVAIVGILGDRNSGKSFLLNTLAEYLRCEEENSHGWIDNLSKKSALVGFALHEQRKPDTFKEGMFMWPHPFVLKKPCDGGKEEKVVVLLLDIDMEEIDPGMEVLMCLLCSTLIYCKNVSEHPDISRILNIRNAISSYANSDGVYNLYPEDVVFQHMMVVFRDFSPPEGPKIKCGVDKSLMYLSNVMKMQENMPWKEEFDKISNKDCFLLKKPDSVSFKDGRPLHFEDKNFVNQLKSLAKELLTIDDLPLKSVENIPITVKDLNKIQRMEFLIPDIVSNFRKQPYMETNLDEAMETDDTDAIGAVQIIKDSDDEVINQIASNDVEMEDVSQSPQKAFEECSQPLNQKLSPQALQRTKLSRNECENIENEEFKNTYSYSSQKYYQNKDFDEEVNNIFHFAYTNFLQFCQNTGPSLSALKNELRQDVNKKLETTFAKYNVPDPAERLSLLEEKLEIDLNSIEDTYRVSEHIGKNELDAHSSNPSEDDSNASEVNKAFSVFLSTTRKNYAEGMKEFFSTIEQSKENLLELHNSLVKGILIDVDLSWKEKMNPVDDITEKVRLELEQEFKLYSDRLEKIQENSENAEKLISLIDKNFARDCENFITSGEFIKRKIPEYFDELLKKSAAQLKLQLSSKNAYQIRQLIRPKSEKCIRRLERMKTIFEQFSNESKKFFQMFVFLNEDQFGTLSEKAIKIAEGSKLDEVEDRIFQRGLQAILKECKLANKKIIKNEIVSLREVVLPRIKNFYDEEMKKITQNRKTITQLKEAHEKLKKECFDIVKKSCTYNDSHCSRLHSQFHELDQMLNTSLDFHSGNNQRKIDTVLVKVKLLLTKARDNYIDLMNKKVGQQILTEQQLQKFHKDIYNEISTLLKIELKHMEEDPKPHIESLGVQIKGNYDSIVEDNTKRSEMAKRERLRQEALERKSEKKRVENCRQSGDREASLGSEKSSTQTSYNCDNSENKLSNSNKISKTERSSEFMAIAIEFGMKKVKCGIMLDGKFTRIPNRWGETEFNNDIAVNTEDEILIGEECNGRSKEEIKYEKTLTEILCTPSEKLNSSPFPPIYFKGENRQLSKELLCGLILSRVKSDAETFLKASVESVVITVPLWYTSSQRQATKDAAKIAGFTSIYLMNEPTAAALAYANSESRSQTSNKFLVIVENVFLDVAVYEYNRGKVEMESCSGYLHHKITGVKTRVKNWFKNNVLRQFEDQRQKKLVGDDERRKFTSSLIEECVAKRDIMEYALICDDGERYLEIQNIANSYGRQATKPNKSEAVLMGAAIFTALRDADDKRARSFIIDRLPYRIEYPKSQIRKIQVYDRHEKLPCTERKISNSFECYDDFQWQIHESGNVEDFVTGYLRVPVNSCKGKRKGEVVFCLNSEGILRVTANYTDIPKKDNKEAIEIDYNSFNMSEEDVAINASWVCSLIANPKLEEERRILETTKQELRNLAEFILGNLKQVKSVFGKDQMGKRATAVIDAIAHPKITLEDINNKISVLTKLKTIYLPDN